MNCYFFALGEFDESVILTYLASESMVLGKMAGKKNKKLDVGLETVEEKMESVHGELRSLREGISKIPSLEQGMAEILSKLNAMSPNLRDLVQTPTRGMGRQKSVDMGSAPGQSNPEKNEGEGDSSREFGGRGEARTQRVEMPTFDSSDPDGWMSKVERFFKLNQINEWEKMDSVMINMEGEVLAWYLCEDSRRPFRSWSEFWEKLLERFRFDGEGTLSEQFLSLHQEGTVREYRQ